MFKMSRSSEKKPVAYTKDVLLANLLVNHIQLATERPTCAFKKVSQHYDIPRKTFS